MATLTVTEREHWKGQIAARIDRKIARVEQANKPRFDALKTEAHSKTVEALGIGELERQREKAQEEEERQKKRADLLTRKMVAAIRGVDVTEVSGYEYHFNEEIKGAMRKREAYELDALYEGDELGKQVLALRAEKDNLLDAVWLATSPAQIKELWGNVLELLGEGKTRLEDAALQISPAD